MQIGRLARLMARIPPGLAGSVIPWIAPVVAMLRRRSVRVWESNLRAARIDTPARSASRRGLFYHDLLLHYESIAQLGGRRFDVALEGRQHLDAALRCGRGLLVATAHLGNWHLAASTLHARTGLVVHSVAGVQLRPSWTPAVRRLYRDRGLRIHDAGRSVPHLVRALRRGEIVALHLDGDQHRRAGPATRGITLLARRTGAPILPAVAIRTAPGAITLRFLPSLTVGADRIGGETIGRILVDVVREHPEQWVLFRPLWGLS